LFELLEEHEELFDGTIGDWKTKQVNFELRDDAQPHSSHYYPMARVHKITFKTEVKRLVKLGVLNEVRESEWGSPTFIIAKKSGSVRFPHSGFRMSNTKVKRKPHPLPKIENVLQQLEGLSGYNHSRSQHGILHSTVISRSESHVYNSNRNWKVPLLMSTNGSKLLSRHISIKD